MKRNLVETLIGAIVLIVAANFLWLTYKSGNLHSDVEGYQLEAKFTDIGPLEVGYDVRLGGIKIGTVAELELNPQTYQAVMTINIEQHVMIPKDSVVAIVSDGLLGGKYVTIEPGGSDSMLVHGDELRYTQDAVNFESLLSKFAFGGLGDDEK